MLTKERRLLSLVNTMTFLWKEHIIAGVVTPLFMPQVQNSTPVAAGQVLIRKLRGRLLKYPTKTE